MENPYINGPNDLVTSHDQTRIGFISAAMQKNTVGDQYIDAVSTFLCQTRDVRTVDELLQLESVRPFLLAASGLSDKSLVYLNEQDRSEAIKELANKFLRPAGTDFIIQAVYRYLLIKGDAVGGTMRNWIGGAGQEKLVNAILATLRANGIQYQWADYTLKWSAMPLFDAEIAGSVKVIYWRIGTKSRVLAFNLKIPIVDKNVDICLFNADIAGYNCGRIVSDYGSVIMLGELKGGIDPAGADEHWKTANTALERIRTAFARKDLTIKTSFIGAAIEPAMANEIYAQLLNGTLSNAANLTNPDQVQNFCNWLIQI